MAGLFEDDEAGDDTNAGAQSGGEGGDGGAGGAGGEGKPADAGAGGENQGDRPEWLPEAAWKEGAVDLDGLKTAFEGAGKAADLPESAEKYTMPTIEGFDAEKAAGSPVFIALRNAAFAGGVGQAGFETAVQDYVKGETERYETEATAERAKLGSNAKARLAAVGTWVKGSLPADQAKALLATATTADSIVALEALMNQKAGAKPRDPAPPAQQTKTREQIEALMATPAYSGKASQRDPAVVKEVDEWFAANAGGKK